MIRVLVADDQEMVRTGLGLIVDAATDMEVVASVPDGRAAVERARAVRPDVCLLDVRMPVLDGIDACREIVRDDRPDAPAPRVVIVTTFDDADTVDGSLEAGACGFLLKSASAALIHEAVRAAASGDALVAPEVTGPLLRRMSAGGPPPAEPVEPLSEREEEVLAVVAEGLTNAEVADRLHVSVATVKTHVNSLLSKLGARNRVELAAFAFRSRRVR